MIGSSRTGYTLGARHLHSKSEGRGGKNHHGDNLAAALAASELKVLLIDSDPQGNSTTGVGLDKSEDRTTLYDVLLGRTTLASAIVSTDSEGLGIVPADQNLVAANLDLVDFDERESRLKAAVAEVKAEYSYVLVDCPPALDLLTLNALVASDSVLVPIQCEFFALEGISQLMDTIDRVREAFNPSCKLKAFC